MKSKKVLIASIIVGILVLGIGGYVVFAKGNNAIAVKVFNAKKENILSAVSATGTVQEGSRSNIYLNTPVRVKKLNIKKGDAVKKGDTLAELDTNGIKIQLEQAKMNYNIEKISLENLKNNQGLRDSLKADSDATTAQTEVRQKQLAYEQAKEKLEENKKIFASNAISKRELDNFQQSVDSALIDLEGARKRYNNALSDSSKTTGSQQAQVEMQASKAAVAELKIKEIMENLKDVDIDSGKVIAPFDGVVASLGIKEGDMTKLNEVAISIVNLDELIINAKIVENDIKDIKIGNKVIISGDSVDPERYEGTVRSVAPIARKEMVDKTEQTVLDVEILVTSKQTLLKPGFNVDIKIETRNMLGVLAVMNDAVKEDKDGKRYVFVVNSGKAKKVDVEVEIKSESYSGIKESKDSVAEGSKVIFNSSGSLKDGTAVKVTQEK